MRFVRFLILSSFLLTSFCTSSFSCHSEPQEDVPHSNKIQDLPGKELIWVDFQNLEASTCESVILEASKLGVLKLYVYLRDHQEDNLIKGIAENDQIEKMTEKASTSQASTLTVPISVFQKFVPKMETSTGTDKQIEDAERVVAKQDSTVVAPTSVFQEFAHRVKTNTKPSKRICENDGLSKLFFLGGKINTLEEESFLNSFVSSFSGNFSTLVSIYFIDNRKGVESLSLILNCSPALKFLDLSRNNFGIEGIEKISPVLKTRTSLTELNLSKNALGIEGAKIIAPMLSDLYDLKLLKLDANEFGDQGAKRIAKVLSKFPRLEHLSLSDNCLGPEGIASVLSSLEDCSSLKFLDLSCRCEHIPETEKKQIRPLVWEKWPDLKFTL